MPSTDSVRLANAIPRSVRAPIAAGFCAAMLAACLVGGAPTDAVARWPGGGNAVSTASLHRAFAQRGMRFVVERDGEAFGFFRSISGIGSEHEVVEFRDGSDPDVVRKIPGRLKYSDITLKRGVTSDLSIWNWREEVVRGDPGFRSELVITMLDRRGNPIAVWHFENAWPSKVTAPDVTGNGDANEFGLEELTIVHEGMVREAA